jgi:hypothetical protein
MITALISVLAFVTTDARLLQGQQCTCPPPDSGLPCICHDRYKPSPKPSPSPTPPSPPPPPPPKKPPTGKVPTKPTTSFTASPTTANQPVVVSLAVWYREAAAVELSEKAELLRDAAMECRSAIDRGDLSSCEVEVTFKDKISISIEQAERLANRYDRIEKRVTNHNPQNLYNLQQALDAATRDKCTQHACNFFVQAVAGHLNISLTGTARQIRQQGIVSLRWLPVSPEAAQGLGDVGEFVVGASMGHVAVVAPSQGRLCRSPQAGATPYVRGDTDKQDPGTNHDPKAAVCTCLSFACKTDPPEWFLFVGP